MKPSITYCPTANTPIMKIKRPILLGDELRPPDDVTMLTMELSITSAIIIKTMTIKMLKFPNFEINIVLAYLNTVDHLIVTLC
jgi:hypothetical protein